MMNEENSYYIYHVNKDGSISSPNNWFNKVWARNINGKIFMPLDFMLVPLSAASRAIEKFNNTKDYTEKLELSLLISLTVRVADTAYFNHIANKIFKDVDFSICANCIRESNNFNCHEILRLRWICNNSIIHSLENEILIDPKVLNYSIEYYNEVLKLPLIDPIEITSQFNVKICKNCMKTKKNKKLVTEIK